MAFLSNFSTRAKLLFGFGLMLLLLATVSTMAYRDIDYLKDTQNSLYKKEIAVAFDLMSLRNAINRDRATVLAMGLVEADQQAALLQRHEQLVELISSIMTKLNAQTAGDPVLAQKLEKFSEVHHEFSAIQNRELIPYLKSGKRTEASAVLMGSLQDKFQILRDIADETGELKLAEAERKMRQSEILVENAQKNLLLANLIAISLGLILVFWLDRIIASPLRQTTLAAQRIATGDLTTTIPVHSSKDEVGQLLRALEDMVNSWKQSLKETNTGIVTLSAAASEILAGTMQSASGASQTAAAVSETTATVEEVKQTTLLASQKARTVSDAAQQASQTAEAGRKAIEDSVDGMESIQDQMGAITDMIVQLSERSEAIAEIIATVSGLAEQSNLLAVNAAIEAAKAGEQGKGFAVVAQEVKELADQSRQATKQVRVILSDIQKAISSAVMLAEQGARTVSHGVEQTTEAGHAIKILADSISNAALSAAQIAATSQQQLAGMDQIAMAMENIKQVSVENAASSRQSEASARNLHELGLKLKQMSERFKL